MPTPPATSSIRVPYAVGQVPLRRVPREARGAARRDTLRRDRLRLPAAGREPAGSAALPRGRLHAQRRGRDLAPARRAGHQRRLEAPDRRSSGTACCASRRRRLARFDLRARRVGGRRPDASRASIPNSVKRPVHVVQTGVDTDYFLPIGRPAPERAHLVFTGSMDWLPNEDGMTVLLPRHPAADPPGGTRGDAQHRRPLRRRRRSASWRRFRASRSPAGSTTCGRTSRGAAVYVVPAADRRRHAAEDFRGDGDGQGGRVDDGRRRGAAGDERPRHRHRRRAGALRACRGPPDSRYRSARARSRRPRAGSSSSATTGPRWPTTSRTH